jgi:hypothetical protein
MRTLKSRYLLPSAVSLVSILGFTLPAYAINFKISGQVDRAVIGASNGEQKDYGFVDNNGSDSRFRFTGDQTFSNGLKVGFTYEFGLAPNLSTNFDINDSSTGDFIDERVASAYLQGFFGKFTFGKGSGASDGTSEVDLSGTEYLGGGGPEYYASGISFMHDNGVVLNRAGDNVNIGNGAYANFDGLSRVNRLRYDSPTFGSGFVFSASLDNGHAYETALRYQHSWGNGGKIAAAADWVDTQDMNSVIRPNGDNVSINRFQEYGGSASLLLPSGLNFTGMAKHRNYIAGHSNETVYFGGIGYIIGKHHFQIGYKHGNGLANHGSKGNAYQAAYVFDWTDSVQLFASYHHIKAKNIEAFTLNNTGAYVSTGEVDPKNINYIYLGTRIKFL